MTDATMTGTRVLVTGAGGFIGSHLVETLCARGAQVVAFAHYNGDQRAGWLDQSPIRGEVECVFGDVRDADRVERAAKDCAAIFHLAALIGIPYSYVAPASYLDTNATGTLNVLRAAQRHGARLIHTSTSEVYGTARTAPISEDHPLQAQSPYAASKIAADKLVESFHLSFGVAATTVRPFNTFGPRQSLRAVIPTIIAQALKQDEIRLGNLTPTRDFTYVADTVDGFIAAAQCDAAIGRTVNLGVGAEISIGDLAARIAARLGRDVSVVQADDRTRAAGSEVDRLLSDNGRMRALTGWAPRWSLDDGLDGVIDWMRGRRDRIDADRYAV